MLKQQSHKAKNVKRKVFEMKALKFADGIFRLFSAEYGSEFNNAIIFFRVRIDRNPYERAKEKGIKWYDRLTDCTANDNLVNRYASYKGFQFERVEVNLPKEKESEIKKRVNKIINNLKKGVI